MRMDIDWAELAPMAAIRLLGEPDKREENGRVWRWSGRGGTTLAVEGQYAGRFHIWSEDDKTLGLLDMIERETGQDPMEWLADSGLVEPRQGGTTRVIVCNRGRDNKPAALKRPAQRPSGRNPAAEWASTVRIPPDEGHPARLWLADWRTWRPGHPLPQGLRWQSAEESDRRHNPGGRRPGCRHAGAGNLVALIAPLSSWASSWPGPPRPIALQLIAIDAEGRKALDCAGCGVDKRTIGPRTGGVFAIGNPAGPQWPPRVVEGVKDALALASRYTGPVYAVLGSMANPAPDLVLHLAGSPVPAVIHADNDANHNAGRAGARVLAAAVMKAGGVTPRIVYAPEGKDAGDTARRLEFPPIDPEQAHYYAQTLRETEDWPAWEIVRQTALAVAVEDEDDTGRR